MILEVATLEVRAGQEPEFEIAFREACAIIASMPGYISHDLRCYVEKRNPCVQPACRGALRDR